MRRDERLRLGPIAVTALGAALLLSAHDLGAATNPGAPLLAEKRFGFCHDEDYPLTGKDARWCPLVGERSLVCPALPVACTKPPQPIDLELTLGGGDGRADDGDDDAPQDTPEPRDDGDGDAEGRASRNGEVNIRVKPGDGSGDGKGDGSGNGKGDGKGDGSGDGKGDGSGSGDAARPGSDRSASPPKSRSDGGDGPSSGTGSRRDPPPGDKAPRATPEVPDSPPPREPPTATTPAGLSVLAQVLFFAIVAVGVFLLGRAILKHLSWRKKRDDEPEEVAAAEATEAQAVTPERRGPVETDVERLLRRAQEAAQRGDFARAVEDTYAALLRRLDGAGLIEIHPSRTNGDYVRALRDRPDLRSSVRDIVRDVERVQFGSEPPSAHMFRAVFDRVAPIATRAVGVLGVIFAASVLASGGVAHARDRRGDTGPYGTAVIEELLEDRGRDVTHRSERLAKIEDETTSKVLVLLRGADVDRDTWRRVLAWTREGGTLVVAGLRKLPKDLGAEPTDDPSTVTRLDRAGSYDRGYRFSGLEIEAPPGTKLRTSASEPDWILARDEAPYAVERRIGKGRAYVFAERALFTNVAFTVADGGTFAVAFLDDLGKDEIELCDVWTGAGATNPLEAMDQAHLTPVIAQLLAVALLFLFWRGAHFGRPRDPPAKSRRAFADHVKALGHIYHRAQASEHALGNFAAWAIERLRERYTRGHRAGLSPLAEAIATRTGVSEAEVMRVLVEAQSARDTSGPPSSFRPDFRGDVRPPARGANEERELRLMRALFDFLRTSKERPRGARASKPS